MTLTTRVPPSPDRTGACRPTGDSGHMVQGHVDETGEILERWQEGDSLWVKVRASPAILPYIVEKG